MEAGSFSRPNGEDDTGGSSRMVMSDEERARLLDKAVQDICEADFVAVDLEFTGLFPQQSESPKSVKRATTLEEYFDLCVQGAEFFLAPQLGICAARRCGGRGDHSSSSSYSPASKGGSDVEDKSRRAQQSYEGLQGTREASDTSTSSADPRGGSGVAPSAEASGALEREANKKEGISSFACPSSSSLRKNGENGGAGSTENEGRKKRRTAMMAGEHVPSSSFCNSNNREDESRSCDDLTELRKWQLAPYTFYAFPSQKKQAGVDTATLRWLLQNGLDFNQWIASGFDYFRLSELQMLEREQMKGGGGNKEGDTIMSGVFNSTGTQKQPCVMCNDTEDSTRQADGSVVKCTCEGTKENGVTLQAMYNVKAGTRNGQMAVPSFQRQPSPPGTFPMRVSRLTEHGGAPGGLGATGLQRIVEAIIENEKPLVVHNGHLDLLHLFDKFIGKAPDTLPEFCKESLRTTSLPSLRQHLLRSGSLCVFEIAEHRRKEFDLTFQQLNCDHAPECGRSHEAGYDALLTAQAFVLELDLYAQHYAKDECLHGGDVREVTGAATDDLWALEEARPSKKRRKKQKQRMKRHSM
ncbi:caf1 family ribonuclease [Cystoisospora suis]|uniref:Caf1 family ribonuclease n=1 Tax=Cystoisospora suis TaxID=483139 RepID=A0A2C6KSS9_9APIC|nr:caf1 family ribonuclease [Cystoisospora suis]